MQTYQIVLVVLAAVFLFLYIQRRKSRLNKED